MSVNKELSAWAYIVRVQNQQTREETRAQIRFFNWMKKQGFFEEAKQ